MLSGLVVVFGAYQFNGIPTPEAFTPAQSTIVFYSDGTTPMAKLGTQNRTLITLNEHYDNVKWAVIATEDDTFYKNSGVSFRGIARSAWNNIKGGETQGGSTISQQYMRQTLTQDPSERNYKVKVKEALGAIKLDEKYSKDKILEMYLNVIYFGRGAYGIEAAAQAYFNKSADKVTMEEAMVLAGVIKDPGGGNADPKVNKQGAIDRWEYTRKQLVKIGKISKEQAAQMKYPDETVTTYDPNKDKGEFGKDSPTGIIVHHVMDELTRVTDAQGNKKFPNLKTGGYRITTTINKDYQNELFNLASVSGSKSILKNEGKNPEKLQAGVVSIDPNTGEVVGYYGGDRGDGFDYSGIYTDPELSDGQPSGSNHPPGSTMKIYTLAAAIKAGISIDSYWMGPKEREFAKEGRTKKSDAGPIHNSGASCPAGCTLVTALQQSMNTVYYAVGVRVGPAAVVDMAHAMGVNHIWDNDKKRYDLDPANRNAGAEVAPAHISTEVAIGQFGITVQDHANGVATIAAGGIYRPAHFVRKVTGPNDLNYVSKVTARPLADQGFFTTQQSADLRWAMEQVMTPGVSTNYDALRPNGWETGGKSGTWELPKSSHNGNAWFVGFTPKLATAVWVGNKANEEAIYTKDGRELAGANLPGHLFKAAMTAGLKAVKQTKNEKIPKPGSFTGDDGAGETGSPAPTNTAPTGGPCQVGIQCPTTGPGGGNGGGPGGGGPGGGGPGGGNSQSATPSPSVSRSRGRG
jgi:membrane peptidoglycan carboxypeptidase